MIGRNERGFSLVELMIVIAIMAVLMGVTAPQYLRYVEKTRIRTDDNLVDTIITTSTLSFNEPKLYDRILGNPVITVKKDGSIEVDGLESTDPNANTMVAQEITTSLYGTLTETNKFQSKAYNSFFDAGNEINITYVYSDEMSLYQVEFISIPHESIFYERYGSKS